MAVQLPNPPVLPDRAADSSKETHSVFADLADRALEEQTQLIRMDMLSCVYARD